MLADHGRAMTFLVADGVTPSNEGRGYVLRRVIRRAVVHGRDLGLEAFLPGLAGVVVEQMGGVYPELVEQREAIGQVLAAEEEKFGETLARGLKLFEEAAAKGAVSGDDAFTLQATYGFPVEMTAELARERGLAVDLDEFGRLMAEHREVSRAGTAGGAGVERAAEFARAAGFQTEFVGYEKLDVLTQIGAWRRSRRGSSWPSFGSRRSTRRAAARSRTRAGSRRTAPAPSSWPRTASARTRRCSSRVRASPPVTACARSCRGRCASRR